MTEMLAFWAAALVAGILGLPISFAMLRRLPDAGAALAMPFGLVLAGYLYFIFRVVGLLPFGRGGYLLALVLLALISCAVAGRDRRFLSTLRRTGPALTVVAGVFTCGFFAYVAFRSYNAEISGTEQPMDFMYLNATLTSKDYPPKDPWMAGEKASYYYFGYLQAGVLTSVADVVPSTGYNLFLAYTFGAAAAAIASLGYAFARWTLGSRAQRWTLAAGGLAVGMLLLVGSLSAIFEWSAAHGEYNRTLYETMGVEWMIPCRAGQNQDCYSGPLNPRTTAWYPTEFWFWWRGTRIIPNTITEFPFFSFLLGDMHPHVMAIPVTLLSLGLSAAAWRGRSALDVWSHRRSPWVGLALAIVFGGLAFQNAWDLLTFSAILGVAVLVRNLRARPPGRAILATAGYLAPVFAVGVIAYIPWYMTFSSQASGFFPYVGHGSRPAHAFLQFGPLLAAGLVAALPALRPFDRAAIGRCAAYGFWVPLVPFSLWVALARYHGQLGDAVATRGDGGWLTLGFYGSATWALSTAFLVLAWRRRSEALAAGLAAVGALLLYGAELFFIRDIFVGGTPRLNTVFKLTYQAWILLSAGGGVAIVVALRRAWHRDLAAAAFASPAVLLLAAGLVYPLIALPNRVEGFDRPTAIDGLAFLARSDPPEYALTRWVQDHTAPGDVIIEATGRAWRRGENGQPVSYESRVDYSDAGRISARTGRQTPIGWEGHEVQWRGDNPANHQEFQRRQDLVDGIYTATDVNRVVTNMHELGATYLVVGRVEQTRYTGDIMPHFESVLEVAFESEGLRVYRLPAGQPAGTK